MMWVGVVSVKQSGCLGQQKVAISFPIWHEFPFFPSSSHFLSLPLYPLSWAFVPTQKHKPWLSVPCLVLHLGEPVPQCTKGGEVHRCPSARALATYKSPTTHKLLFCCKTSLCHHVSIASSFHTLLQCTLIARMVKAKSAQTQLLWW